MAKWSKGWRAIQDVIKEKYGDDVKVTGHDGSIGTRYDNGRFDESHWWDLSNGVHLHADWYADEKEPKVYEQ